MGLRVVVIKNVLILPVTADLLVPEINLLSMQAGKE